MDIRPRNPFIRLIEGDDMGAGGAPPPVTFTPEQQAAIDQIVQGRVAQASRTAAAGREAEIQAYLAEQKRIADLADADEITRLRAENEAATARAAAAEASAQAVAAQANATTALAAAGVLATAIPDALRLIDPSAEDLPAEIEALKTRLPALFTGTTPPATPPPNVPPARPTAGATGSQSIAEQAAAMRAAVFPHRRTA